MFYVGASTNRINHRTRWLWRFVFTQDADVPPDAVTVCVRVCCQPQTRCGSGDDGGGGGGGGGGYLCAALPMDTAITALPNGMYNHKTTVYRPGSRLRTPNSLFVLLSRSPSSSGGGGGRRCARESGSGVFRLQRRRRRR